MAYTIGFIDRFGHVDFGEDFNTMLHHDFMIEGDQHEIKFDKNVAHAENKC
jgi:hypothetical protein